MNDLRIDSMIAVPVEYLTSDYKNLLKALTVPNPEYKNSKFFAKGFGKKSIPANLNFFDLDEVNRIIYIPRNIDKKLFDINNYNIIYNNTINNIQIKETIMPTVISAEPRDYQKEFLDNKVYPHLDKIKNKPFSDILINAGCGAGKCHGKGTKILMFDGSVKNVEDIKIGELLMGDDSTPRKVLSLARGQEEMFLVKQKKGESYTANKSHILSLQKRIWGVNSPSNRYSKETKDKYGEIVNISIEDYLKKSKKQKRFLYGYSKSADFPEQQVLLDPYFLGLWLGDGGQHKAIMTTDISDKKLIDYYYEVADSFGCTVTKHPNNNKSDNYDIVYKKGYKNPLTEILKVENLLYNKHIPNSYIVNSREIRLKVLAGLIDSDGSYSKCSYSITQKRPQLIKDIQRLCWSLGYKTKLSEKIVKNKTYYRINITGNNLTEIPVRLERKKAVERIINKDASVTGIEVISLGMGDYYGFTLDGNHLYQLHDGTVTHNTFLSLKIAQYYGVKTLVCVTQTKIGNQFLDTCRDLFKGWSCGWENGKDDFDITVATYSLLSGENYGKDYFGKFGHYIYDEYHRCGAVTYMEVLRKSVGKRRTSLTATPRRKDGLYKILQSHAGEVITMDRSDMQAKIFPITTGCELDEWRYRNVTRNSTKPHNIEPYSEVCLKDMKSRQETDRGMIISIDKVAQSFKLMSFNTRKDVVYSFMDVSIHTLGTVSTSTMDTDISMRGGRNLLVLSIILKLRKSGRKVVLLSKRKDQLFMMERTFKKRGIKCGVVVSDKDATYKEHCKKLGKTTKEYSKWVFEEADVLLGIDKLAEEGMDAPRYDTLVYLHPIKDIEQSIGRVLRERPDKPQPLGIYLIDKVSVYHNSFYGQKGAQKEFKRLGHDVQNELSLKNFEQITL